MQVGVPLKGSSKAKRSREGLNIMSVQAFILIQTEVGKASSVAKSVSAIPGVTLAEGVTGPYDVIMRAEAPSMEEFGRSILSKVQAVAGITRTLTCPVTY